MNSSDVHDVLDVLDAVGIEVSIEGGWGVDALFGQETREHADLDLALDRTRCETARTALEKGGFAVDETPSPVGRRGPCSKIAAEGGSISTCSCSTPAAMVGSDCQRQA